MKKGLVASLVSILFALAGSAIFLNWYYADKLHKRLVGGRWPVNSYRYNERTSNYEFTPGFSAEMLNKTYYLKIHELGYRISKDTDSHSFLPGGILSIGCSFTFGDDENAEDTFTYLAAEMLGVSGYNYGVPSYSYASSILQLRDLEQQGILEKLKPSIIVLGAGGWLIHRSLSPFYPTNIQLGYPYLREGDGSVRVANPPGIISVKHAIGFATSSSYFDSNGSRRVELNLRRRLMLMNLIPRVLIAKAMQRFFENGLSQNDLHRFVLTSISEIARNNEARFLTLSMPWYAKNLAVNGILRNAIEKCGCTSLVDGGKELATYGALSAKLAHPSREAHLAYAKGIVETFRKFEEP